MVAQVVQKIDLKLYLGLLTYFKIIRYTSSMVAYHLSVIQASLIVSTYFALDFLHGDLHALLVRKKAGTYSVGLS